MQKAEAAITPASSPNTSDFAKMQNFFSWSKCILQFLIETSFALGPVPSATVTFYVFTVDIQEIITDYLCRDHFFGGYHSLHTDTIGFLGTSLGVRFGLARESRFTK